MDGRATGDSDQKLDRSSPCHKMVVEMFAVFSRV
jgi:hypothetical protein